MSRLDRATPDAILLRAYRSGELCAWELLVERYEALVCAIPRRMGLSSSDVEDVAQTVFITLLNHVDRLQQETRLSAWLVTTTKREAWRLVQRQRTRRSTELPADDTLEQLPDSEEAALPGAALLALEQQHQVRQALAQLPDRCRELLTLLYLEDPPLAYALLAERLGIPVGSVGPQRARCLERLKKILQALGF
jgi:RNA polymerase sigma factor (sigma-70 family)